MSDKICPKCKKPYISMEVAKNKERSLGAPAQEWYKHSSENYCTRRVTK